MMRWMWIVKSMKLISDDDELDKISAVGVFSAPES